MNARSLFFRHCRRWAALLPGLMLLAGLVVGGIHHHAEGSDRACAVCTASHAPAAATDLPAIVAAPTDWSERVDLPVAHVTFSRALREHRGRAPPLS